VQFDNWKIQQNEKKVKGRKSLQATITSISSIGLMTIFFNQEMNTNVNLTQLSSNYYPYRSLVATEDLNLLNMYISPFDNWVSERNNYNLTKLNFTWEATSFVGNILEVQLDFHSPSSISPLLSQDTMIVDMSTAIKLNYFKSIDGRTITHQKHHFLKNRIRTQMKNDNFSKDYL